MTNGSLNIATAPVIELPENVRIPLHSLQADLGYLIARVIADGSCGSMIQASIKERLDAIEAAVRAPASPSDEQVEAVKTLKAFRVRVDGIMSDYAELPPEEDETWESWFHAAFDMAGSKISEALREAIAVIIADRTSEQVEIIGWSYEIAYSYDRDANAYLDWRPQISFEKPNAPKGSVRRLQPLSAALTATLKEKPWQPIATAPKDKTILGAAWVKRDHVWRIHSMFWNAHYEEGFWQHGGIQEHPTHWRPLPPPPSPGEPDA